MSFFSDLFHGDFSHLGTDLEHAPSSLAKHPSELYETLGGAAALATGGLALGGLGALGGAGEAAAGGLGSLGGLFGGGAEAGAEAGGIADAFATGSASDLATADSLVAGTSTGEIGLGATPAGITANAPTTGLLGLDPTGAAAAGGDITGSTGAVGGQTLGQQIGSYFGKDSVLGGLGINSPLKALGVLGGAGALGYDVLQGRKPLADQSALQSQATQLSAQGQQFMSYLQAGKLPAGLQTLVDKQTQAAKAMAISNAAKNGQSTDPTTNTQLADAINSAQQQATMQVAQLGEQLFQQGMNETQVSAQIMQYLTNLDEQQTQSMGKSIAAFAASLAGGGIGGSSKQTITIGGQ